MAPDPDSPTLVATRRITGREVATGEVALHPDLEAVELVPATTLALAGGGQVVVDHDRPDDSCVLAGAPGWVGRAAAGGDLLSFTWDGRALTVAPAGDPDPAASGRVVQALRTAAGDDRPPHLAEVLRGLLDADPRALAGPARPVSELLEEAGLEYHHGWIGPPGTDWGRLDAEQERENELAVLAVTHRLTREGFEALQGLLDHLRSWRSAPDPPGGTELAPALAADRGVAPALLSAALGPSALAPPGVTVEEVEDLARRALGGARGSLRAPAAWVLASCAERAQDWAGHEALVAEAVAADPEYAPALRDAAWTAADRGQSGRAAALLASAGLPADDPRRQRLDHFAQPGPNQGGRNDPCKCGSGRKGKACCLPANGWPIESRLSWLYEKALAFLSRPAQRPVLAAVAEAWVRAAGGDEAATRRRLADDPLPEDLALFEGGVLARFVEARGPLLPADEAATAASWVGQPLRLCEVVEVRAGEGLTLEDLAGGERIEVVERSASRALVEHLLVCVRVLPDGREGHQLFGGVRMVPFGHHDGLLELLRSGPDAAALATWWAVATSPPGFTTRDGAPSVLGRAVLSAPPGTGPAVAERLAGVLDGSGGDDMVLLGGQEEDPSVVGWARVVDDRVVLEANAVARLEALTEAVGRAAPELVLLDSVVVPLEPALVERWAATSDQGGPGPSGPRPGPEAREMADRLAEQLQAYERRWVDESIPALGGATPREAAADPSRRRDLERLLAEMGLSPGGMDPERVRSLLDLGR